LRPFAGAFEQRRDVIGRGHLAPAPRGGERRIAVSGGHVENALARANVEGFAQILADDLKRGPDNAVVAGRPGRLLAGFKGREVDRRGRGVNGIGERGHEIILLLSSV
jgi:hypothetical protein